MNYYEYNALQSRTAGHADPHGVDLDYSEAEVMEVDEDYTCTVDDVRAYIRAMHDQRSEQSEDAIRLDGQTSKRVDTTVAFRAA